MATELKIRRVMADMTQEELAKKSGVSRSTIWKLEKTDNATTTTDTLNKLAAALGCETSDFFTKKV